jgi:hypothetical protein
VILRKKFVASGSKRRVWELYILLLLKAPTNDFMWGFKDPATLGFCPM